MRPPRPSRVVMELSWERRIWVCRGGVWSQWPMAEADRHLMDFDWEYRYTLPAPDPAERRVTSPVRLSNGVVVGQRWEVAP